MAAEAPFTDGPGTPFYFMPGGYCAAQAEATLGDSCVAEIAAGKGLVLDQSLDTVLGTTEAFLDRESVVEEFFNNVIADAMLEVANEISAGYPNANADIAVTNGFRFGVEVPAGGDVTLRTAYTFFPIGAAVSMADFSGEAILDDLETVMARIFNRNPYEQSGGWNVALSNATQILDLDNRPTVGIGGRIVAMNIGGMPLNRSKRYKMVSCYPHGDPTGHVCRSKGGANMEFFALADRDDYTSNITLEPPLRGELPSITAGPTIWQNAPDAFLHPVHLLQRYFDLLEDEQTAADQAAQILVANHPDRIRVVNSTDPARPDVAEPVSAIDPTFIQPPEGAGPWLVPFNVHR